MFDSRSWDEQQDYDTINNQRDELRELRTKVARLQEWKETVLDRIKAIPEYETGKWSGDKEGWGFCFELIKWQTKEVAALRAKVVRFGNEET